MSFDKSYIDNNLVNPEWWPSGEFHEVFKQLRDEEPLYWAEPENYGRNFWVVTRYDDVKAIMADSMTFSNSVDSRIPRSGKRLTTLQRRALMWDVNIAMLDPPFHTVLRQPMNKHFSVPAINKLKNDVEKIVDELIEELKTKKSIDIVNTFAAKLPMDIVFAMLGIPEEDWPMLEKYAYQAFSPADPKGTIPGKTHAEASYIGLESIGKYGYQMARDRLANPRDDMATVISKMVVDGTSLDEHEIATWFLVLILGGLETTRNAIGAGMWTFLANPDQKQLLIEQPDLAGGAVEEVLRWVTPARGRLRVAKAPYRLHGKVIKPLDWVFIYPASGNKDERKFDNPHKFDITRTSNEHLALGEGIHACLGRALVRLELKTLFSKIFEAFPNMDFANDKRPHWVIDHQVSGVTKLEVNLNQ
ncbi:cytochrome P450 [Advenella incenata]|uniref:Cytochrome P450 n=1 Tax=Advenella incenata TaxID=267800 RepID=A0A4Q7VFT8_9BURK|nr:cytochrome P450 [Advenella incenata]RZT94857.1 cytochrome P450 [Advenella incenata]